MSQEGDDFDEFDDHDDDLDGDEDDAGESPAAGEHLHQQFQFQPVSARVPERVAKGVFSTGAIVLQGPDEFLIDFILKLANPHQVSARVILPMSVVPRFIAALQENLRLYEQTFGDMPRMPMPRVPQGGDPPPDSIEELYEQLKLADDQLGGAYANAVMIGHAPAEFCFDFIANLYPKSVVVARVYMSAPQVPALLDVLVRTWKKFEESRNDEPPPSDAGGEEGGDEES
ncbi:MAG: DUF3467 domain-containing protein [Planctomycetaceae bacterium]|nr:DUF3467 domain-containing protein [Planctomycetaceae bacterium]